MSENPWTPEPWKSVDPLNRMEAIAKDGEPVHADFDFVADRDRAVVCVNSMAEAGIQHPEHLGKLIERLSGYFSLREEDSWSYTEEEQGIIAVLAACGVEPQEERETTTSERRIK